MHLAQRLTSCWRLRTARTSLALPILVLAAGALARRFRQSRGVERQQLKAFTYVAALAGVGLGVSVVSSGVLADTAFLVGLLALASLPIVAGVAVMRHGLYQIDVVIKRTLVYGTVTVVLVATYLGLVLVLQVAAQPVDRHVRPRRRRARRRPRRRCSVRCGARSRRARTVASTGSGTTPRSTLQEFGQRLRHELDLDALGVDLRRVVSDTMAPTHVSLWLRREAGR